MKKLKFLFPEFPFHSFVCLLCLLALIGMGAFAIWCPPKGDIPENVLKFGWLLVFVITIFQIRPIISECGHFRFTKGDTTLVAGDADEPEKKDN